MMLKSGERPPTASSGSTGIVALIMGLARAASQASCPQSFYLTHDVEME
jgi:hypothetical protein